MSPERILIVDDSATQLEALRAVLTEAGLDVHAARSGEQALTAAREHSFDLVLSDVVMPGMSGYDLCRRIKAEVTDPPLVILLTSLSDPRDIVRGVECGADNYITKPYEPAHLLERVRKVVRTRDTVEDGRRGAVPVEFLGETFRIRSDPQKILSILLSSFEDLIRTNDELQASKRSLADAHRRELQAEQAARERAEADTRRMEALKKKAEDATRARDEVLATVSHDLRNPLSTIFTSASLLQEIELAEDAKKRQVEIIRRTAEQMNRLIQDLLDVSRIDSGAFSVTTQPETARSLVLEAFELHNAIAEREGISLTCDAPQERVHVLADRGRVLQVFSNLVGNAIRFTPAGGRIALRAERRDDTVEFSIVDTGSGIPRENLPHIFNRFWHAGRGGSGLGLTIARGIVEAHGGRIWVESDTGGSTFTFALPVAPGGAGAGDAPSES